MKELIGNESQYSFTVFENDERIDGRKIDDPFIHTTLKLKGLGAAWKILTKGITLRVNVSGTTEAHRVVFCSDYTPEPVGPPLYIEAATCNKEST